MYESVYKMLYKRQTETTINLWFAVVIVEAASVQEAKAGPIRIHRHTNKLPLKPIKPMDERR